MLIGVFVQAQASRKMFDSCSMVSLRLHMAWLTLVLVFRPSAPDLLSGLGLLRPYNMPRLYLVLVVAMRT
jgi:hypothetical protein